MRRSIVIALTIVVIATSYGEFIAKTKVAKGAIQRNIYSGKEASALQCAHRCKFLSTTAVTVYKDELELCSCVEINEDKSEGNLTDVLRPSYYKAINVALNRPSEQISTYPNLGIPNDAKCANDGDLKSRSATKEEITAWWSINSGAMYRIRLIKLFLHRYSLSKNYYGDIKIETRQSDDGQWIVCDLLKTPHKLILETSCQTPTWTSFVRVVNMKYGMLSLAEMEVYA